MAAKCLLLAGGTTVSMMAAVPALSWKVHAGESTPEPTKMKITELPIYESPVDKMNYVFVEEEVSSFRSAVSNVRQSVWSYLDSVKDTTDSLKQKYETGKAHTTDLITYIQEDPAILPRAGVITIAGLGGIVAGYKGGIMRKLVLSSSAIAAASALCYPKEAVAISTDLYKQSYDAVRPLWEGESKSEETPAVAKPAEPENKLQNDKENGGKKASKPVNNSIVDKGQSKDEDKDMYTTRGS